jgi:hypothetical protein
MLRHETRTSHWNRPSHLQPVEARLDPRRQFALQRRVVEAEVHMRQDGPVRLDPVDPFQGLGEVAVSRLRLVADAILWRCLSIIGTQGGRPDEAAFRALVDIGTANA